MPGSHHHYSLILFFATLPYYGTYVCGDGAGTGSAEDRCYDGSSAFSRLNACMFGTGEKTI